MIAATRMWASKPKEIFNCICFKYICSKVSFVKTTACKLWSQRKKVEFQSSRNILYSPVTSACQASNIGSSWYSFYQSVVCELPVLGVDALVRECNQSSTQNLLLVAYFSTTVMKSRSSFAIVRCSVLFHYFSKALFLPCAQLVVLCQWERAVNGRSELLIQAKNGFNR